jgi:hypothetical protein
MDDGADAIAPGPTPSSSHAVLFLLLDSTAKIVTCQKVPLSREAEAGRGNIAWRADRLVPCLCMYS